MVRVSTTSGRISIFVEDRADVDVDGSAPIQVAGNRTTVNGGSGKLEIRVPIGSDLIVGSTSGRIDVQGRAGSVSITSGSGKIRVEHAQSVDARSSTGRIEIASANGACSIRAGSGSVSVGSCGRADVATESGRIDLDGVQGSVSAHCTTGRIDIRMDAAADVIAETISGRIALSLPPGVRPFFPSGTEAEQQMPSGTDCTVRARSVTGRVEVRNR